MHIDRGLTNQDSFFSHHKCRGQMWVHLVSGVQWLPWRDPIPVQHAKKSCIQHFTSCSAREVFRHWQLIMENWRALCVPWGVVLMNHWRHVSHISRIMCHQLHLHFLPRMCSTPIVDNAKIRRFPCLASASTHLSWKGFSVISLELGLETHKPNQQKHTTVVPWSWLFYSENAYQATFCKVGVPSWESIATRYDLLDVYKFDKLGSFFNVSTTRNYLARLCPTAAPPSCTAVRITKEPWLALQMSSNLCPLGAQKTVECIVLCLAHVESLPKGPHNKQFPVETTSRRIETCES